jgi:hypothetical protein
MFPRFADYNLRDGESFWFARTLLRTIVTTTASTYAVLGWFVVLAVLMRDESSKQAVYAMVKRVATSARLARQ